MTQAQSSQTNRLLGYPDGARLLIINADDFGRSHACNAGILRSFEEGVVSSTTLMVPCPWALHAMQLLSDHPALGSPEMQAIEPESWQAHPTDLDFLISREARSIIEQEGIVLLSYKPLQQVWRERCSSTT